MIALSRVFISGTEIGSASTKMLKGSQRDFWREDIAAGIGVFRKSALLSSLEARVIHVALALARRALKEDGLQRAACQQGCGDEPDKPACSQRPRGIKAANRHC